VLFGIATSIEIFKDRLPKSAIRTIDGKQFDVVQSGDLFARAFTSTVVGEDVGFRLGPSLANVLLQRQKQHIQSIEGFIEALQVCLPLPTRDLIS
jgi:origin recognition complex subunit 3